MRLTFSMPACCSEIQSVPVVRLTSRHTVGNTGDHLWIAGSFSNRLRRGRPACAWQRPSLTFRSILAAEEKPKGKSLLAVAKGKDYEALVEQVLKPLGGMAAFVKQGDRVVVKPNIGWDRTPEQAANTHPDVVKAVVQQCLDAGAKQVLVFDRPCNEARRMLRQERHSGRRRVDRRFPRPVRVSGQEEVRARQD